MKNVRHLANVLLPLVKSALLADVGVRCLVRLFLVASLGLLASPYAKAGEPAVDFASQIQPLLTRHCSRCHGSQNQESGLNLLSREDVLHATAVVVPGDVEQSVLWSRITDSSAGDLMPPDSDPLTAEERNLIRRWIEADAPWPDDLAQPSHWAYQMPKRPHAPQRGAAAIDFFVDQKLAAHKLEPSPPADRTAILRRASLSLIGLPPHPSDVQQVLAETERAGWQVAYTHFIDRLLASPEFGRRWATPWLDAARYADSNGYQADQLRDNWAYRDWVIQSINQDLPIDQFVIEQIAGDLLPNATLDQRIATGFHRMTTCNVEAGVDPEDNRVQQVIDRVNTTATALLGTTFECAQCHDHKYDPFSQKDYYRFFAFFNNTPLEVEFQGGVRYDFTGPLMSLPLDDAAKAKQTKLKVSLNDCRAQLERLEQPIPTSEEEDDESPDNDAEPAKQRKAKREALKKRIQKLETQIASLRQSTLVMVEMETPRPTFVLERGNYQNPTDQVQPGPPAVLHDWDPAWPRNRLGLARWLVSPENPLMARVLVNRWWSLLFGNGIVRTTEDFGSQSEPPSHPKLLDWLAVELVDGGYSRKNVIRQIVLSQTFQRSRTAIADNRMKDPQNRWLSWGPAHRLAAETIRDNALTISGLISPLGDGPPVMPYQPPGIWKAVGRNQPQWKPAADESRFRRGVFVIWKRGAPYPSFVNFDAPDRASCTVQRGRTNTPLQALTLLNDPAYVEMALAFATRVLNETTAVSDEARLHTAFQIALARDPSSRETSILQNLLQVERERMRDAPDAAKQRTTPPNVSGWPTLRDDLQADPNWRAELAAWHAVAATILNLDEVISL